jgi:hypothetical protein
MGHGSGVARQAGYGILNLVIILVQVRESVGVPDLTVTCKPGQAAEERDQQHSASRSAATNDLSWNKNSELAFIHS